MPPKKGQFPERPPTLAEALYSGKEIGTKPENHEQILKDLNLDALRPKKEEKETKKIKTVTKSTTSTVSANKETPKAVRQLNAHIDTPIPNETPSTIESTYILPSECEAVTNLEMEYMLYRRSNYIRSILSSRVFSSLALGIFSLIAYRQVGEYFSDYTFRNGNIEAFKSLYNNSYFMNDFVTMLYMMAIFVVTCFSMLKFLAAPFQKEADKVPENFEKYFGVDLNEYAALNINKNYNKLSKSEKEIIKYMKDNTFSIVYKDVPVAFLVCKQTDSEDGEGVDVKILSYGIRRVYMKADLLKDLIAMMFRKFIRDEKSSSNTNNKVNSISVDIFNFETYDVDIFKRAGFYRKERESLGFLESTILGITKDTYVFETDSIEF